MYVHLYRLRMFLHSESRFFVRVYILKNLKWTRMAIPFWVRIYVIRFLYEMYFLFSFTINNHP